MSSYLHCRHFCRADSARSKATEAIKVAEKARLDAEKAKCQFLAHSEQQREKQRAAGRI